MSSTTIKSVNEAIRTKRAVRRFRPEPLPEEIVTAILHAGRRAQSSKNDQPWSFVVVTERATLKALSETGTFAGHLADAAVGIVFVSKPGYALDLGQAAAYMQLAAWEYEVGSCIASFWRPAEAKAILGVPSELDCDFAISFGYPLEDQPRPAVNRGRRPFEDVVHFERWRSE